MRNFAQVLPIGNDCEAFGGDLMQVQNNYFLSMSCKETAFTHISREGGDPAWVPATLQGVGVSVARLLDVYNRLYTAKDSVWLTSGDELHILKAIPSTSTLKKCI